MAMTRRRRFLIVASLTVSLLGATVMIVPPLLWGDGIDYSHVAAIQTTTREFQDPSSLAKAWALPVAQRYRAGLHYQSNGSFCGPASVANVMRSLGHEGDQKTVLNGTGMSTFLGVLPGGMTLDQLADVAQKKLSAKVTILRDLDLEAFRAHLRGTNDPSRRYIMNFNRGPLFGKSMGHHSPIAGYLADEDLVLVLDVNEKYGPWLARSERLLEAIDTVDRATHKKRGLLLMEEPTTP
jgi:hypothetical protein